MTREEAIKRLFDVSSDLGLVETIEARIVIDEIFDDFDSRICKNCKYFKKETDDFGFCEYVFKKENKNSINVFLVKENFCCNRFERREDERN